MVRVVTSIRVVKVVGMVRLVRLVRGFRGFRVVAVLSPFDDSQGIYANIYRGKCQMSRL